MLQCFKCQRHLDTRFAASGVYAICESCDWVLLSLGHLIHSSDSVLVQRLWEYVQAFEDWKLAADCPRCRRAMDEVDLEHRRQPMRFHACRDCYLIAISKTALDCFLAEGHERKLVRAIPGNTKILDSQKLNRVSEPLARVAPAIYRGISRLLDHPQVKPIQSSVVIAGMAFLFGFFTTLMPYASLQELGFYPEHSQRAFLVSAMVALFAHLDWVHLLGSIAFFWPLATRVEREIGTIHWLTLMFASLILAFSVGPLLTPFLSVPAAGLSPITSGAFGYFFAQNRWGRVPVYFRGREYRVPLWMFAGLGILVECHGIFPKANLPLWFNATYDLGGFMAGVGYFVFRKSRAVSTPPGTQVILRQSSRDNRLRRAG